MTSPSFGSPRDRLQNTGGSTFRNGEGIIKCVVKADGWPAGAMATLVVAADGQDAANVKYV